MLFVDALSRLIVVCCDCRRKIIDHHSSHYTHLFLLLLWGDEMMLPLLPVLLLYRRSELMHELVDRFANPNLLLIMKEKEGSRVEA